MAVVALVAGSATGQVRVDKKLLGDSLTAFCSRQASVGKIKVKTVRVKNDTIAEVYATKQLSTIPFTEESVDSLYAMARYVLFGKNRGRVHIYCEDKQHEVSRLVKAGGAPYAPELGTPLTRNASRPYSITAGLDGQHIALWGSHGIYFNQTEERWLWQRAKILTTVEDLYTTSYTMPFLVPMLENAGAVVLQPRERDTQLNEVIVDEAVAAAEGDWIASSGKGWGPCGHFLLEGDNPFEMGHFSYTRDEHAQLTYTPALPEAGEYAVYVSYRTEPRSTQHARYTVCHRGMETTFEVNQSMGGSMWVYLGTFDFSTDTATNYVRLAGRASDDGVVTADAVRFGGGWGCVARYPEEGAFGNVPSGQENGAKSRKNTSKNAKGSQAKEPVELPHPQPMTYEERARVEEIATVSGYPRWIEGARYYMQYSGVPATVYNYTGSKNDYIDDYASRGVWVNWLNGGSSADPEGEGQHIPIALSLAFHTDAGNIDKDSIVGTLAIYTDYDNDKDTIFPNGASRMKSRDYANCVQTQIVDDIRRQFAPEWTRRMLNNSGYSESRMPKVPALLLELLSHQNFADMQYGLDPRFRFVVSRAIYKGMLRFLHEQYGTPYVVQPLPVEDFAVDMTDDVLHLTWTPITDPIEPTARPTYYVLYTRIDNGDWDNGKRIAADGPFPVSATTVEYEAGQRYDFKVVAGNEGGISFPSEVLSAYKAPQENGRVLIVNGFHRVAAPEAIANTDSMAGFLGSSYPVAYKKDVCYIGAEYDFCKAHPWTSDDDAGFGASYADKAKETEAGNRFDYPVQHGKALQALGYSFVSCSAGAVDSARLAGYDIVDIIMGKQKETQLGVQQVMTAYKTFTPSLQQALRTYQGNVLCSGCYVGTDMRAEADLAFTREVLHYEYRTHHATRSGKVLLNMQKSASQQQTHIVMEQNPDILPSENNDAIRPAGEHARTIARYDDSGLSAGVAYDDGERRQLIFSFPLESVRSFEPLYNAAVRWLMKE